MRSVQTEVATGENQVGIELDVGPGSCGFEQDVATRHLNTQGTGISITLANQNRTVHGLQDEVTSHHQVRLDGVCGSGQCTAVAAHTLHGHHGGLADFDSGGFVNVHAAGAHQAGSTHVSAELNHFSLDGTAGSAGVAANALAVGERVQTQLVGIDVHCGGYGLCRVVHDTAAGAQQADGAPRGLHLQYGCDISTRIHLPQGDVARRHDAHRTAIGFEHGAVIHGDRAGGQNIDRFACGAGGDVGRLQHIAPGLQADVTSAAGDSRVERQVGTGQGSGVDFTDQLRDQSRQRSGCRLVTDALCAQRQGIGGVHDYRAGQAYGAGGIHIRCVGGADSGSHAVTNILTEQDGRHACAACQIDLSGVGTINGGGQACAGFEQHVARSGDLTGGEHAGQGAGVGLQHQSTADKQFGLQCIGTGVGGGVGTHPVHGDGRCFTDKQIGGFGHKQAVTGRAGTDAVHLGLQVVDACAHSRACIQAQLVGKNIHQGGGFVAIVQHRATGEQADRAPACSAGGLVIEQTVGAVGCVPRVQHAHGDSSTCGVTDVAAHGLGQCALGHGEVAAGRRYVNCARRGSDVPRSRLENGAGGDQTDVAATTIHIVVQRDGTSSSLQQDIAAAHSANVIGDKNIAGLGHKHNGAIVCGA